MALPLSYKSCQIANLLTMSPTQCHSKSDHTYVMSSMLTRRVSSFPLFVHLITFCRNLGDLLKSVSCMMTDVAWMFSFSFSQMALCSLARSWVSIQCFLVLFCYCLHAMRIMNSVLCLVLSASPVNRYKLDAEQS